MREYNRSWNYYGGMTPDQIDLERRRDAIWHRPTWPFSRGNAGRPDTPNHKPGSGQRQRMPANGEERRAAKELDLALPYTEDGLKSCYRARAKAAHPDLNPNEPNAEERFKRLREAYMTLQKPFTK